MRLGGALVLTSVLLRHLLSLLFKCWQAVLIGRLLSNQLSTRVYVYRCDSLRHLREKYRLNP